MDPSITITSLPVNLTLEDVSNVFKIGGVSGKVAQGICITKNSLKSNISSCLVIYSSKCKITAGDLILSLLILYSCFLTLVSLTVYSDEVTSVRVLQLGRNITVCHSGIRERRGADPDPDVEEVEPWRMFEGEGQKNQRYRITSRNQETSSKRVDPKRGVAFGGKFHSNFKDPKTGCDQQKDTFWYKILDVYNTEAKRRGFIERTKNMLTEKWTPMNASIQKFNQLVAETLALSGENDEDWITRVKILYKTHVGTEFKHKSAWLFLKSKHKWTNPESTNARRYRFRVTNEEPAHFGDALPQPPRLQRIAKSQRSGSNSTASFGSNPLMYQEFMKEQYELDRKAKMEVIAQESEE
nr:glutathione S-transferase T3-like isoform X1 [Tanacetum cinerariifolium]